MTSVVHIKQSSLTHPGHLTEEDLVSLHQSNFLDSFELSRPPHSRDLDRGEAGLLILTVTFLLGGVTAGILQEAGKDIYKWARNKLISLMRAKREVTRSASSKYPYRDPTWELVIDASHGIEAGFKATITASSPEAMEEGIRQLSTYLGEDYSTLDLAKCRYSWRADETVAGIKISRHKYVA